MVKALSWILPVIPVLAAITSYTAFRKHWPKALAMFLLFFADNPLLWAILIVLVQMYGSGGLMRPLVIALSSSVLSGAILYVTLRVLATEEEREPQGAVRTGDSR